MIPRPKCEGFPTPSQLWGLRILFFGGVVVLPCALTRSAFPAMAFALAWGPNGLFLILFMRGVVTLPQFLVSVLPMEPVLYRWLGVGLIKRIVATRMWPQMNGWKTPPRPGNRQELLDRTEGSTRGAEVCHGATFILAFLVALFLLSAGLFSKGLWVFAFNMLLNGYPIMLQRVNRWRVHQVRALTH